MCLRPALDPKASEESIFDALIAALDKLPDVRLIVAGEGDDLAIPALLARLAQILAR